VLFSGSKDFEKFVVESIASTPKTTPPLDACPRGIRGDDPLFCGARQKQDLTDHIRAALADLRLVAAETVPRPVPARTRSSAGTS
jgi:hypothetical protein